MHTTHINPFGLEVYVSIPESKFECRNILEALFEHEVLAADTETVGLYSERLFVKARRVGSLAQKCQELKSEIDSVYEEFYRGKKGPEAIAFRNKREEITKKYNKYTSLCASLKNKAIEHTGGLHFWENKLGCIQIGYRVEAASVLDSGSFHTFLIRPELIDSEQLSKLLNTRKHILLHNAKFDWKMLKQHLQVDLKCENLFDTMIAEYALTNGKGKKTNLGVVTKRRLEISLPKDKDLRVSNWTGAWTEDMVIYASLDVVIPFMLFDQQMEELIPTLEDPHKIFKVFQMECQLVPFTARMEMEGIGIDVKATRKLLAEKKADRDKAVEQCVELFGIDSNLSRREQEKILNSPKELKTLISDQVVRVKDTNALTLIKLADKHQEIAALLEYRKVNKVITTYLEPFLTKAVKQPDGSYRVYGELKQTHTETQRYSSEDPNLQNMPATEEFRNLIIPRPGHVFISGDLANIEPRILAQVTKDPLLMRIFKEGKDPYIYMAFLFLGVEYDQVTKEQRKTQKPLALAAMYGKKEYSLSLDLGCDVREASEIMKRFFNTFIGVRRWVQSTLEFARTHGYIETIPGLRRYLPDINSDDPKKRSNAENAALNTQIQGFAAWCMKNSVRLAILMSMLPEYDQCRLVLTIHDELLLEVPDTPEWIAKGKFLISTALVDGTRSFIDTVPIKVGSEPDYEPSVIYKWGEMKA